MTNDELIDELFDEHDPQIADVARQVRSLMRDMLPDCEERVHRGWHGIGFVHPELGYVGGVFPRADVVKIGFEQGHRLYDPDGTLEQPGTRVAYLNIRSISDVDKNLIEDFLHQLGVTQA